MKTIAIVLGFAALTAAGNTLPPTPENTLPPTPENTLPPTPEAPVAVQR